jgi:hypothetical protein
VSINPELSDEQKQEVSDLLLSFSDVLTDLPGCTNLIELGIKTISDTPCRSKSRPIPYAMIETINKEIEQMTELGVIEQCVCFTIGNSEEKGWHK